MLHLKNICYFLFITTFGLSVLGLEPHKNHRKIEMNDILNNYVINKEYTIKTSDYENLLDDHIYEEQILFIIQKLRSDFEQKYFSHRQKNTPERIKKFAYAALRHQNIAVFTFLVNNNSQNFNYLFDMSKCSIAMLARLLEHYVPHSHPISLDFGVVFLEKAWAHGNTNKFEIVLDNILNNQAFAIEFLNVLIKKIKLNFMVKNNQIIKIIFGKTSKEHTDYLMNYLPPSYLDEVYDIIAPTLLFKSLANNDLSLVKYLLKRGAISYIDLDNVWLFFANVKHGHADALDYLLNWIKDYDHYPLKGILASAAKHNSPDVILYLLKMGFDPNESDEKGNTFAHVALFNNITALLPILDEFWHLIDYRQKNNFDMNLIDSANMGGHEACIDFINQHVNKKKRKVQHTIDEPSIKRQKNR